MLRQSHYQATAHQRTKIEGIRSAIGMQRTRIPVSGELERAEPKHLTSAALVAGFAVRNPRDRMRFPGGQRIGRTPTTAADEIGFAPILTPGISRIHPTVGLSFQIAGLDPTAVEGEFLPKA